MSTVGQLIDLFKENGISPLLLPVRKLGIKSSDAFFACELSCFNELSGEPLYDNLRTLHSRHSISKILPAKRKDFPLVVASSQACLSDALSANRSQAQAQASVSALVNDFYAHSSTAPRDSLWHTWCKLAQSWGEEPLPLTRDLALKMGASFKLGKYKSVANYFSRAKSEEADTLGTCWSQAIEKLVKKIIRSVLRGLGGCSSKQAFALEQLNALPKSLITETRLAHDKNATSAKLHLVILGSWFLLREIEVAAAEAWHLTVDNNKQICTWMLSATKTDPRAIGTSRSHGCCCQQGRTIICPYHTARDHLQCIQSLHGQEYTAGQQAFPLFPRGIFAEAPQDKSTAFLTKPEVISYTEHVAQLIVEAIEYITPQGKRNHRFGGHVMRVMGAQLLARADVELNVIKLVGRWGSSAIERYVQEAPLHLQQHLSSKVVIGQDVTQQQAKTAKTHHSEHMSSLALQLKELHKRIGSTRKQNNAVHSKRERRQNAHMQNRRIRVASTLLAYSMRLVLRIDRISTHHRRANQEQMH